MAPMHFAVQRAVGIVLVEKVIVAFPLHQAVWVIHPMRRWLKMVGGTLVILALLVLHCSSLFPWLCRKPLLFTHSRDEQRLVPTPPYNQRLAQNTRCHIARAVVVFVQ